MSVKIQIRRGTATEWSNANPTLAAGELGYDTTNDILKVGDGSTAWSSLAEADNQSADQVTYSQTGQTFALGANVQAAIYAIDDELIVQDGRLDIIEGNASTAGSIAKALQDAKDYADAQDALQDAADEISYSDASQTYALGSTVQAAIYAIDDELIAQDGRLDTLEGDANTAGSVAKAEADAKAYADAQIDAAKLALGTNYAVADIAARDALEGLTVGDLIFVTDDGDTKWAQYKVTAITDGDGSTSTFEKIMDEDVYLNAISASAIKTAYESNADTNALTDAGLQILAGEHPANQVFAGPTTGADDAAGFRALVAGDIPSLDAAKITSGTFSDAQIPSLEANKITTGTFDAARIPNLSANKITTDTLDAARIPTLAQSKITDLETDLAAKVAGPASATSNNFATFDGTTGKLVQDSGFSASSFAKISIGSTEPSSPSAGDLWFNNDVAVKNLFFYDGTDWIGVNTYQ